MTAIKPRGASIIIYQGDDLHRLSELREAVAHAERVVEQSEGQPRRGGDEIPSADAEKAAFDAFVDEASQRAVTVDLRALGRKRFAELVAEHPPRMVDKKVTDLDGTVTTTQEIHPKDANYEVNVETFPLALLGFVDGDVRTIVSPEFGTKTSLQEFLDFDLSEGDFQEMWVAAYWLNRSLSSDPKALRYSTGSPRSTEN